MRHLRSKQAANPNCVPLTDVSQQECENIWGITAKSNTMCDIIAKANTMFDTPPCPNCERSYLVEKKSTTEIFFGHTLDEHNLHRCYRCFHTFSVPDDTDE